MVIAMVIATDSASQPPYPTFRVRLSPLSASEPAPRVEDSRYKNLINTTAMAVPRRGSIGDTLPVTRSQTQSAMDAHSPSSAAITIYCFSSLWGHHVHNHGNKVSHLFSTCTHIYPQHAQAQLFAIVFKLAP